MNFIFEDFSRQLEERIKPYLPAISEEVKQKFPGVETSISSNRGGNLAVFDNYDLIFLAYFPGLKPYDFGIDNDEILGQPALCFSLRQQKENVYPRFDSEVFLGGTFGFTVGQLFEKGRELFPRRFDYSVEITPDTKEAVLTKTENEMAKMKDFFFEAIEEYLDIFKDQIQ